MSIYVPGQDGGFLHADAEGLASKLKNGDGLTFSGDPSLELLIGVIEETRHGVPTGRVARRYEVWRHTEAGEDVRIGHWRMDEFHQILPDVVLMHAGARGRAEPVLARIDAANAAIEKANDALFRDSYGEIAEHALNIRFEGLFGKTFFGQAGKGLEDAAPEPEAPVDSVDAD